MTLGLIWLWIRFSGMDVMLDFVNFVSYFVYEILLSHCSASKGDWEMPCFGCKYPSWSSDCFGTDRLCTFKIGCFQRSVSRFRQFRICCCSIDLSLVFIWIFRELYNTYRLVAPVKFRQPHYIYKVVLRWLTQLDSSK